MRCSCLSCECKYHYIFRSDRQALYIFLLFQSPLGSFLIACEGHDEVFGNHPLECTLRSYSRSKNLISRNNLDTRFLNLSFRKSSYERGCTNHFVFNRKFLFHVTFVLSGRNSGTNKTHPKETSRTWYWFGCVIDATKIFFKRNRDKLLSESVNQSKTKCEQMEIPVEKRIR